MVPTADSKNHIPHLCDIAENKAAFVGYGDLAGGRGRARVRGEKNRVR